MGKKLTINVDVELPHTYKQYSCSNCGSKYIISSLEKVSFCPICSKEKVSDQSIMYGAGWYNLKRKGEVGMFDGPTPHLEDLLNIDPGDNPGHVAKIYELTGETSEEIYRWSKVREEWVKVS